MSGRAGTWVALAAAVAAGAASPVQGQDSLGVVLQRASEAASRVDRIRLRPDTLVVRMGDTVSVEGVAVDSLDAVVEDALWGATEAQVFGIEVVEGAAPVQAFRLWGTEVGKGELGLFVATFGPDAQPRWRRLAGVEVTVLDYPVAEVRVDPLPQAPYVGTAVRPSARVITTHGTVHEQLQATWSTSDPTVAAILADGRVRFYREGRVSLVATAESVSTVIPLTVLPSPVTALELPALPTRIRTGDVIHLAPDLLDADGHPVDDAAPSYVVESLDGPEPAGAVVAEDGGFVAERPGRYRIAATVGEIGDSVELHVFPRDVHQEASLVAHVPTVRTTDLWVFEGRDGRDYAYTGTMTNATMYAMDVTEPANPVVTDSVTVDGRRVNDVKVNDDRTLGIITSENASNRRNGITLLDLADPAHPKIITHYTTNLTGGVHNVWFVGDLVYAVNDGTLDVHIIDVSDRAAPVEVGRWGLERPGRYLHDVSVVDGLAYLSYWNDGVVILDVGAGIKGGTPVAPVFVSSYKYRYDVNGETYGNTHHAFRYGDYLFLGDEIFGCPECSGPRGYVHVLDVRDIEHPVEVARYEVPEAGSHNLWVEDDRLYVAYYQAGLRIVDISGELRGDLLAQGREIASFETHEPGDGDTGEAQSGSAGAFGGGGTMAWGPQPYKGHVFVSDMNSGLWIVQIEPAPVIP